MTAQDEKREPAAPATGSNKGLQWCRNLLESVPHGIQVVDTSGTITYSNLSSDRMFGYEEGELVGRCVCEIVEGEQERQALEQRIATLAKLQPPPETYVSVGRRKDGSTFDFRMDWVYERDESGEVVSFISAIADISDHMRAKESLAHSEILHRTTIDAMVDALHVVNRDHTILLANEPFKAWCKSLGLSWELKGKSIREAFPFLADRVHDEYREVLSSGEPIITIDETTLDGRKITTETRKVPVLDKGEVERVITLVRDITEQRATQEELHHAKKMDALGQLAGGIAHDFNNVLGTIIGCVDMLQVSTTPFAGSDREYLETIVQSAQRAADLTTKLLKFGKKAPTTHDLISVSSALDAVVSMVRVAAAGNIEISLGDRAEPDLILGDMSALQSSLLNLALNAVSAMPKGGKLTLVTRVVNLDDRYCDSRPYDLKAGSYLEIEVRDTGVGIPKERRDKIFEPFFTTKEEGTGLGLATVYGMARELGGEITLESAVGEGTAFFLRLPAYPAA